jgi:hypothetical protein
MKKIQVHTTHFAIVSRILRAAQTATVGSRAIGTAELHSVEFPYNKTQEVVTELSDMIYLFENSHPYNLHPKKAYILEQYEKALTAIRSQLD